MRSFNSFFPNLNKQLKASWRIFAADDINKIYEIPVFLSATNYILEKYTLDIGRFGRLIKVEDKIHFEKETEAEKTEFLDILKLKPNEKPKNPKSKYLEQNSQLTMDFNNKEDRRNIGFFLSLSMENLKKYMQQMIIEDPESVDLFLSNEKTLLNMIKENKVDLNDILPQILTRFIKDKLRFPDADDMVEKMDVSIDYYDVSNEMLYESDEFKNMLVQIKDNLIKNDQSELKIRQFSDVFENAADK